MFCFADPELVTLYARLVAQTDLNAAQKLLTELPPVDALPLGEVDGLEAAGVGIIGGRKKAETSTALKAADEDLFDAANHHQDGQDQGQGRKNKKKRKRKPRLPKGFDPQNPGPLPDPERWLPKWQRSDAKKARKKRKDKEMLKGSQGAGKVDANLDASAAKGDVTMTDAGGKKPAGGGGGGKKGKKKGKR